jgi:hypothetical protein
MSNAYGYDDNYVEMGLFPDPFFNINGSEKYDIFSICYKENLEQKQIAVNIGFI